MELKRVIGLRRSVRFLNPERPVERAKIQMMLEAARRASHWGNVQALRAVVIERATAPREVLERFEGLANAYQVNFAPIIIAWYLDTAAVDEQPERLREIVDARAMGVNYDKMKDYLERTLIPFFVRANENLKLPGPSEIDCGQGIAQATLVAFDEGLGCCLLGGQRLNRLGNDLGLPASARILLLQTVGYPAEDVEASGQRPRLPFEELFHLNRFGVPFPRDTKVVQDLEDAGMIQRVGPDDRIRRDEELAALALKYGFPNH
ncbi:nitroreductase family protein [Nocardia sp. SC052]|uniref:nitroreductase family protein n=1 Tax=Nocardia sichangensis TaxID=3385975 RepID=UPI0039A2170D